MTRMQSAVMVCVWLTGAGLAEAQTPKPTIDLSINLRDKFTQADADGNGALSRNEATAAGFAVDEKFDTIDTDHDGVVNLYEIGSYLIGKRDDWASADTNGDGQISREEADRAPSLANIFTKVDRNGDGIIRKEEYEAFSETTLYQNVDLPYVVPNIINKKF
jgi:Ca2+-binding EF-hand superfamily protein